MSATAASASLRRKLLPSYVDHEAGGNLCGASVANVADQESRQCIQGGAMTPCLHGTFRRNNKKYVIVDEEGSDEQREGTSRSL